MFAERKSIRKYKPDPISEEDLRTILEAGRVAPSAKNRQPWEFIVFTGVPKEEVLAKMEKGIEKQKKSLFMPKKFKQGMASADNTLRIMREAPVIILVLNIRHGNPYLPVFAGKRVSEILDTLSIGAAIENMLLAATRLGIGSLWIGNTVYAHKEITDYLGTKHQLAGAIALGYANETPEGRPKKSLDDIVEFRR
ncbi:MAG: nitroreductase family protein [Lachnospiraceae bacterium]|nr:nitroreductase family protein [Lachnospiraceae bacterium]MBR1567330.1 nitroreductase family protein [Lachnospiraceae bacterium]